jgi:hypothetical protein
MPEMTLRWPQAAGFNFLWLQIFGYMGWPHDQAERNARIARYFAEQLAGIATLSELEAEIAESINRFGLDAGEADRYRASATEMHRKFTEPARRECLDTLEEFGWFKALLSAPGNSRFPSTEVVTTGHIMITIRSIETRYPELRGGSVKKSAFLLEHTDGRNGLIIRNERDIRRSWVRFKDIAHLAAAFVLTDIAREDNELEELLVFLMIARDFEKFGVSFYPHAQKSTLLNPEKIWVVPTNLCLPDCRVPVAPPLHEVDLAILQAYRA